MIANNINTLLEEIDIVSFFTTHFLNYNFHLETNSYIIKGSENPFENDRFIFFVKDEMQYFYYFKDKNKGNLFELITISDIGTFSSHSKFRVTKLILEKYLELNKIPNVNYIYFKEEPSEDFLYSYFKRYFNLKIPSKKKQTTFFSEIKNILYYQNYPVIPVSNLEDALPITYRFLNDQKNKLLKPLNGVFVLNYYELPKIHNLYIFYRNKDLLEFVKNSYNPKNSYISVLENTSRNLIDDLTNSKTSNYKITLIDNKNLSVNYFNFLIILNLAKHSFTQFNIEKQHNLDLKLNSKTIQLKIYFSSFSYNFSMNLYKLISKAKAYNVKIKKDYYSYVSKNEGEYYLNYNTIIIHKINEKTYLFHIPLEKQALSLFNSYFILLNNLKQVQILSK